MASQYCLHHVSARCQHPTEALAQDAVRDMLLRLETLRPLIERHRTAVLYDVQLDYSSIERTGRNLLALVNSMPRDDRLRWFLAVKKHALVSRGNRHELRVHDLPTRSGREDGSAPADFLSDVHVWLSFPGTTVFDAQQIEVVYGDAVTISVSNCTGHASLVRNWPLYERSPKHGLRDYQERGLLVSAMDLSDVDAQAALLVSHELGGNRYATVRGKVYRFIPTNSVAIPPTFHGFRVDRRNIAPNVVRLIEDDFNT